MSLSWAGPPEVWDEEYVDHEAWTSIMKLTSAPAGLDRAVETKMSRKMEGMGVKYFLQENYS